MRENDCVKNVKMENPIILITSSEEEEEEAEEEDIEVRTMKWRSKVEEYRMISDLSGFENVKAMMEAEGSARRKKRNRAKKRRNGAFCEYECRIISDLSDFHNLKDMIEAEALLRRNKMEKKRKLESCDQEDVTVNTAKDKEKLGKDEAVEIVEASKPGSIQVLEINEPQAFVVNAAKEKEELGEDEAVEIGEASKPGSVQVLEINESQTFVVKTAKEKEELGKVEASKPGSVQVLEINEPQSFVIDATNKKEDASTITSMETTKGIGSDDGVNSSKVIELCSPSLEAYRSISNVSCCRGVEDTVQAVVETKKKKKRRRRKKSKRITEQDKVDYAKEDDTNNNIVLRRCPYLIYFDPPDCNWVTCSNCGKENHTAVICKAKKRKKACFLCGSSKHSWKYCRQGQDCFIRNGTDHLANDRPETDKKNNSGSNICLRCGDPEHDMLSCRGDYAADDLEEIQCYVCRSFGHLCCVEFLDTAQKQVSCYNCGQSDHLGSECPNSCEATGGTNPSVACYKCGEKGHIARRCGTNSKDRHRHRRRLRICDILPTPRAESLPSKSMNHTGSSFTSDNFQVYHPNFVGKNLEH